MATLARDMDARRRQLLMDRSVPGRMGTTLAPLDVPVRKHVCNGGFVLSRTALP